MQDAYQRIYAAIAAVPFGTVAAYGMIATRAGLPGRARMIGRALRERPGDVPLPWHRILRADGRIGLAPGSDGYIEQCRLLRAEGVTVADGRVPFEAFDTGVDTDAVLWGLPE